MKFNNQSISIIIPNWNGRNLLEKYLPAVIAASQNAQIIIVDDNSTDNSVSFIKERYPEVQIVERKIRGGFATAVNEGVIAAIHDIVLLLNTDIEPTREFLEQLLQHFSNPSIFAVGCLDKSEEHGKEVERGRGILWWEKGFVVHKRGSIGQSDTDWVSCGSGAFKRSIWLTLGGLDTLFSPFYWEDIDISYRARKAGYTIKFEEKSVVIHRHEEGAIQSHFSQSYIKQIAFRNQLFFIWKNIDASLLVMHFLWLPIVIMKALVRFDYSFLLGFFRAVIILPKIIRKRVSLKKYWKVTDKKLLFK